MPKLDILRFPDPKLHTVAKPVKEIDARIKTLIADMLETMYDANGIGLAATQVDVHERLVVIDTSEERDEPMVLINPEITWMGDERVKGDEGCLSVPTVFAEVKRAETVTVRALDRDGQSYEYTVGGLEAVCIQHEMDHLDGKVFVDELTGAGFKLEASSDLYARPADPRTANVFDPVIRGQTDQFTLRFRKPK